LTDLGRQQALAAGRRLQSVSVNAVVSAPEQRCRDTALAITLYRPFPMVASVDGSFTSKAYESETPLQRASRAVAAVNRFLGATTGDVVVVSHGHLIELMAAKLTGVQLAGDVLKREMVNAGVKHMTLDTRTGRWSIVASDPTVYDD
jgi:broad specificity phosphatase PhoE